jgi:hypothetical protein
MANSWPGLEKLSYLNNDKKFFEAFCRFQVYIILPFRYVIYLHLNNLMAIFLINHVFLLVLGKPVTNHKNDITYLRMIYFNLILLI